VSECEPIPSDDHPTAVLDILYVDASKLAEQPTPSVKAQVNYWFDKCAWHRPSILILDNLDKLLSAEVEVGLQRRVRYRRPVNYLLPAC